MLFGRRGARTAVARAFVGCAVCCVLVLGERVNGADTGCMDRGVAGLARRAGNGMLLIIGSYVTILVAVPLVSMGAAAASEGKARARIGSKSAGLRMQSSLIDSIAGMNTISGEPFRSLESRLARVVSSGLLVCWEI